MNISEMAKDTAIVNNNKQDNVYGAVIMTEPLLELL